MTQDEIEKKLSQWLAEHQKHVMLIDWGVEREYRSTQITWEEFFINLYHMKKISGTFIVIKQPKGPLIIWSEK